MKILIWGSVAACIVCTSIWFGLFFGLIYSQIRINSVFLDAKCEILSVVKVPYTCCDKYCSGCSTCLFNPTCGALLSSLTPGPCCDGYYCCSDCCDTCTSCTKDSNGRQQCSTYSCNCRCCVSTPDQLCQVICQTCWNVQVQLQYTCNEINQCCHGYPVPVTKVKECGKDQQCANDYMAKPYFNTVNHTVPCFFDPDSCTGVEFEKGYTWWYWFIWSFPTLTMLVLANFWSFYLFEKILDSVWGLIAYIFVWWVVFFPLIFLVPLARATKDSEVPPNAKNGVLAFALVIMVLALAAIAFVWFFKHPLHKSKSEKSEVPEEVLNAYSEFQ